MVVTELRVSPKPIPNISPHSSPESRVQRFCTYPPWPRHSRFSACNIEILGGAWGRGYRWGLGTRLTIDDIVLTSVLYHLWTNEAYALESWSLTRYVRMPNTKRILHCFVSTKSNLVFGNTMVKVYKVALSQSAITKHLCQQWRGGACGSHLRYLPQSSCKGSCGSAPGMPSWPPPSQPVCKLFAKFEWIHTLEIHLSLWGGWEWPGDKARTNWQQTKGSNKFSLRLF